MKVQKETVQVMNVDLYCEHVFNEKPPIVLIHGFLSSTYTFNKVIPLLAEYFSVLAIDLPGFGRSEKSKKFRYSFENYAKLVTHCMDHFNIDQAFLVGHSMGGQIVLNVAKNYPERVRKLVLLNSSGYLKRANRLFIWCSYLPFFPIYVHHHVNKHDVRQELENVLYDHSLITDQMITEYKRPLSDKLFYHSLIRLLRHREGDLSSKDLQLIDHPSLILWGKEDQVVSLRVGKRLHQELKSSQLVVFEQAGHLITEEKPMEITRHIVVFTNR
ncbi:alpha/beta fold hydrolase [Piscibacillus halophilus]|uniref:Pimeloyl-ACP methyl ester carboxylesterase n=1 Tax=Piscibacillus halophilus TaxID=571933 RepID=A0A1H9M6M7_9BACI|nr:alpha/beta hydrolase [Piscibacillus halophilus]SER19344.1 Pimeloyl-ACP methyl ester carboxylesterase [Piscibacillus halophilus]